MVLCQNPLHQNKVHRYVFLDLVHLVGILINSSAHSLGTVTVALKTSISFGVQHDLMSLSFSSMQHQLHSDRLVKLFSGTILHP